MKLRLSTFLKNDRKSTARELLLTSKVKYDLMVAAAASGYDLLVYEPTVDSEGFDLILDDRASMLPVQLKSKAGKKDRWDIHRKLIRPHKSDLDAYGLHSPSHGSGRNGGILLIEARSNTDGTDVAITYHYTDILIINLLASGVLKQKARFRSKAIGLLHNISSEIDGTFELPKWAFLEPKSTNDLLRLAGLSANDGNLWREHMFEYLCSENIHNFTSALGEPSELRMYLAAEVPKIIV
jgi:hypothetical protein